MGLMNGMVNTLVQTGLTSNPKNATTGWTVQNLVQKSKDFLYLLLLAPDLEKGEAPTIHTLAAGLGLKIVEYTIQTEEGYIIKIHRIPGAGPPVLLQHALICVSDVWLTSGRDSLAYVLSKSGYDVWMSNVRGARYGCEHVSLSREDPAFWKFTFHHFGKYDIPAAIDKIISVSTYQQLTYIGHSMGGTVALVMASTAPRVMQYLNLVILLAPVAVAGGITVKGPIQKLAGLHRHQRMLSDSIGLCTFPPEVPMMDTFSRRPLFPIISNFFFQIFAGFEGFNGTEDVLHHLPSQVSIYTILHYSQILSEKRFMAYDWGSPEENMRQYSTTLPPLYNINMLTAPTAILFAAHDKLAPFSELEAFYQDSLPNLIYSRKIETSHTGIIWGAKSREIVSDPILELLHDTLQ